MCLSHNRLYLLQVIYRTLLFVEETNVFSMCFFGNMLTQLTVTLFDKY